MTSSSSASFSWYGEKFWSHPSRIWDQIASGSDRSRRFHQRNQIQKISLRTIDTYELMVSWHKIWWWFWQMMEPLTLKSSISIKALTNFEEEKSSLKLILLVYIQMNHTFNVWIACFDVFDCKGCFLHLQVHILVREEAIHNAWKCTSTLFSPIS